VAAGDQGWLGEDEGWPPPPEPAEVLTAPMVIIDLGPLTFAVVAEPVTGLVVDAPPVARWTVGRHIDDVRAYYRRRGAGLRGAPEAPTIRPDASRSWGGRDIVDLPLPDEG
jgi:hypothetical protein